jgi:N-acetylmuramoyl-L-alanine amidase
MAILKRLILALKPLFNLNSLSDLRFTLIALLFFSPLIQANPTAFGVVGARVWPSSDYTRITLESKDALQHRLMILKNPNRVVLDLENVKFTPALKSLADKITQDDPYIKSLRIGQFKPTVIRLVFDLKSEVKAQAFQLTPIGEYANRLTLDLYPLTPPDPLLSLIKERNEPDNSLPTQAPPNTPRVLSPSETLPLNTTQPVAPTPGSPSSISASEKIPPMAVKKTGRLINIAIDAGHGGEDPGAKGPQGTWEKDVTLAIAQRLRDRIEQEPNMRAILIRDGDFFIPLQTRVIKARRGHADLFISIHADAYTNPEARGSSVFALSERGATSVAAKWLARKENQADLIGGVNIDVPDPYLKQTLLDLSQTATINDSLKLARAMLSELSNVNRLHKNTIEQAGFAVLKSPDIPSILVETAFITNPEEELKLITDTYQSKMAEAIFNGIKKYLGTNPALAREVSLKNIKSPK